MALSGTPTTIADIVAALNATLLTLGVSNTGLGRGALPTRTLPPSVIWIPTRDRFESVEDHMPSSRTQGPRWLKKRMAGFRVHLWAAIDNPGPERQEDFSPLDDLIEKVISALQINLPGQYELDSGEHEDEEDGPGSDENVAFGRAYFMDLFIAMPVRMQGENVTTKQITAFTQTDIIGSTSTTP